MFEHHRMHLQIRERRRDLLGRFQRKKMGDNNNIVLYNNRIIYRRNPFQGDRSQAKIMFFLSFGRNAAIVGGGGGRESGNIVINKIIFMKPIFWYGNRKY